MSKSDQAAIAKYFSKKNDGIRFISGLAIAFGSVTTGVMLSQLLYWHGKGKKKPWTYKTTQDFYLETGLTHTQQMTAIKKLKSYGILEVKLKGVPATRHFKIDLERLHFILPSLKETNNLHYLNPPDYYVENGETITKITRESTSKSTIVPIDKNNYFHQKQNLTISKSVRGP